MVRQCSGSAARQLGGFNYSGTIGLARLNSVPLVRQNRQRMEFDAFLGQRLGFLWRSLAIDRAVLGFAVMHLARFLGKFRPDMVGILGEVLAQFLELAA